MDVCSCPSNKCYYFCGGVLMEWVSVEKSREHPFNSMFQVYYNDGYICLSDSEWDEHCKAATGLGRNIDEVVTDSWKMSHQVTSNDTGLSNEPIPHKTLDPKSGHYDAGGIETIEILKAKLTKEQYKGYLLGNIIKYSTRANFKDQFNRDIEKINVYSDQLKQLNEENNG